MKLVYFAALSINVNHLIEVMSAKFLYCKIMIIFLFNEKASWILYLHTFRMIMMIILGMLISCTLSCFHAFLTCIRIFQEAGQVVWSSHLFQNFPQFIVIHTVKGFGIVNKAEIDVFLELSCFFDDPADFGNLISGSSAFSKTSLNIWKFMVHVLLKPGL